jgi:TPR repeat protein
MSLPPAPSTASGSDAALGDTEEQGRRSKRLRHPFISWFEAHPALSVACPPCDFVVELTAHPLYCLASRISVQRWELMLRRRASSRAHAQHWHVYGTDVGLKQRSTLLARAALSEVLVQKLVGFRGACSVGRLLHHVKCVVSRRHFLVSKGLTEGLFQEGQQLYEQQRYGDAARSWGQAALLQHGASHAFLSNMLIDGRQDVPKDEKRAFELAAAGAAMGCAHSKGALGRCLVYGSGGAKEAAKGLDFGRESAAAGSCFGQFVVGKCYHAGWVVAQDDAEAVRLWRLAAGQGHLGAQYNLGVSFNHGRGVAQNDAEAVRMYRLAAAQGDAMAQNNLGCMFKDGQGVAKDYAAAVRLYRLAAAQGHAAAQNNLGNMIKCGLGVAADTAEAIRLYRLAAAQGNSNASAALARLGA